MRRSPKLLIILFPLFLCCLNGLAPSFAMDPWTITVTQSDAQKDIFDTDCDSLPDNACADCTPSFPNADNCLYIANGPDQGTCVVGLGIGDQCLQDRHCGWGGACGGDLPFMVASDSADVWARQFAFRLDATIGVPPDAFSKTGQDCGLPVYRWDVIAEDDYEWIRQRARRSADLFRGYRIDHLVGLYRTYAIPADGSEPTFSPPDQASQIKQGETLLRL